MYTISISECIYTHLLLPVILNYCIKLKNIVAKLILTTVPGWVRNYKFAVNADVPT